MKKKRLIPVLLLKNGWLVQSKRFERYQNMGNPISAVRRLSEWASDEIVYLDISDDDSYDLRRDDLNHPNRANFLDIVKDVAKETFMPMTIGGKIRTMQDVEVRLRLGADKISINTIALEKPTFISEISKAFGAQCVVVSMDVKTIDGSPCVMMRGGRVPTNKSPEDWAKEVQDLGAGEILLNSVDRDGTKQGFDLDLISRVSDVVSLPVIACGGAGEWSHFAEVLEKTKADAVAASNIFYHVDQAVYLAKKYLVEKKLNVRKPDLLAVGGLK